MSYLDNIYKSINDDKLFGTLTSLFLILYGGLAGPTLPDFIKKLFKNQLFKFFILSLVAFSSIRDFKTSLLLSFIFVISISIFDSKYINECFTDLNNEQSASIFKECKNNTKPFICPLNSVCDAPNGCYFYNEEKSKEICRNVISKSQNEYSFYLECDKDDIECTLEPGCYNFPKFDLYERENTENKLT